VVSAGAAGLLAATLAGCIKMDMNISLDGEQANGHMILGLDKDFLAFLEGFDDGEDGPSARDEFLEGLTGDELSRTEGVTVEEWEDDDYVGARYTFDGMSLADFQEGSDEESLIVDYSEAAGTYEVTGRFDLTEEFGGPSEADAEEMGLPPGMFQQLMESLDITISITFPGEVLEHNGELTDTTVTWRPQIGEENEIYALASSTGTRPGAENTGAISDPVSGASSSLTTALLVALGVLVVAAGAVFGIWFARRDGQPAGATPAAEAPQSGLAAPPPPSGGYQPPPGGQQQPSGGQQQPSDGYQPPPGGQQQPPESGAAPR
jgi:hypothetical protein